MFQMLLEDLLWLTSQNVLWLIGQKVYLTNLLPDYIYLFVFVLVSLNELFMGYFTLLLLIK